MATLLTKHCCVVGTVENVRSVPYSSEGKNSKSKMNVLCIVGDKTFTHPGWLKAEAAVLAERHIYRTFTSATKEIFIKCQVHPRAAVCQTHILHLKTV